MGATLAIVHLDHGHLLAVEAETSAGKGGARTRARRVLSAVRPAELDLTDAGAVGVWVGEELRRGGISPKATVLALPRSEAILKHMPLPGGRPDEADLAEMVRLQMARQLTVSAEGSAIDHLPLEGSGAEGASVLVGAVPGDRMAWHRRMASAAGGKLRGVELRAFGTSAILADVSRRAAGPVLGIDAGPASVEFVVVDFGEPVFSRSVYLPRPGGIGPASADGEATGEAVSEGEAESEYVRRVALEAKRTWMSFRASQQGREVDRVAVVGEDDLAVRLRDVCAQSLELPGEAVGLPASVRTRGAAEGVSAAELSQAAPLLGLALRRASGAAGMDFENPRRPPDRAAKYRAAALAAVFLLLVGGGFGYVWSHGRLSALEREHEALRTRVTELQNRYGAHIKAEARLEHARAWRDATVDWLAHARTISDGLPDPGPVLLDELSGSLSVQPSAQVSFEPVNRGYPGRWTSRAAARFGLAGSVRDAQVTWDFRNGFVDGETYRLNITGPDMEKRFDLQLLTGVRSPEIGGAAEGSPRATADGKRAERAGSGGAS